MMSRRPPRDGDSSQPAALPHACRALGVELAAVRRSRELSVEDVAARLILSKRQVMGLEDADPSAFYSPVYFLKGLRKYLAFAGIDAERLNEAPPAPVAPETGDEDADQLRLMWADAPGARSIAGGRDPRVPRLALAAVVLATLVAAGGYAWLQSRPDAPLLATVDDDTVVLQTRAPLPAQPLSTPVRTPSSVEAVSSSAMVVPGTSGSAVQLTVGKATWVYIRLPDNRVVERRLEAGEALEVGPLPVYLAVGTADSVELRVEDRPVALEPFIKNGQVRITRPQLAKLVP